MSDPNSIPPGTSGLSDNAAGGLAYITIIPAIIFLLVVPYNKNTYIRFHAFQCLFLAAAWLIIDIVLGIFGLFGLFGTFFQLIDVGLYSIVALAVIVLWLIALVKALNGERYMVPIVGKFAEKWANM